jgi:Putative adhesin
MNKKLQISVVTLLLVVSSAAYAAVEGTFDRTLQVSGHVDLDVQSGSGNITVHSGNSNSVVIHGHVKASESWFGGGGLSADEKVKRIEQNPPIEQNGNSIRIGHISDEALRNNVSISYDVTVPKDTSLQSHTGSGDERITDLNGPVRANSGSGNLTIGSIASEVRATAGSGDLQITDIKGRVYTETGSGNIRATGVAGGFDARAGSGDITFEQAGSGSVHAQTGSGNIRLHNVSGGVEAGAGSGDVLVEGKIDSDWRIHTGSGEVEVKLPSDAKFNIDARSSSGNVEVHHPVSMQGSLKRNHIEGTVNGGGTLLDISTGSGTIRVN